MGYREGSSKLSKHRRMSRAASLAVDAEGIPLSRWDSESLTSAYILNIYNYSVGQFLSLCACGYKTVAFPA